MSKLNLKVPCDHTPSDWIEVTERHDDTIFVEAYQRGREVGVILTKKNAKAFAKALMEITSVKLTQE